MELILYRIMPAIIEIYYTSTHEQIHFSQLNEFYHFSEIPLRIYNI